MTARPLDARPAPAPGDPKAPDTTSLDATLAALADHRSRWSRTSIPARIAYLEAVRALVLANAEDWVAAGARFKGLDPDLPATGGEEWLGGPYPTVAWLTEMIGTLTRLAAGADPLAGTRVRTRPDGQVIVEVYPATPYDRLLLNGYELDVWMQPGVTRETLRDTVAGHYRQADRSARLTVVLGAGNVAAIPILDALYCLFADGDVVLLKMNPVNQAYGPVFERALKPLVDAGYLAITYGGAEVGEHLTSSPLVEAVHVTGSERTFDAIVFGTGARGAQNKAAGRRRTETPVRAELGGVSPTIVVPGPWSPADIAYQAQHLATQKLNSSGHTCVASQVLVMPAGWAQGPALLEALRAALAAAPEREPFYPGARERQSAFLAANPGAEQVPGRLGCVLLAGVDPDSDHPGFREEAFGPIYLTTEIDGSDPADYLTRAVAFANDRLSGNLGANILVHPRTARDLGPRLEDAIAALRYGCIGVNVWSAFAFLSPRAPWGAFPGNTEADIQSGTGVVHNALLFDRPERTVLRAPFRPYHRALRHPGDGLAVKPPWFLSNATAATTARRFTHFAADPAAHRLPAIVASAVRG